MTEGIQVRNTCRVCGQEFTKAYNVKSNGMAMALARSWDVCGDCRQKARDDLVREEEEAEGPLAPVPGVGILAAVGGAAKVPRKILRRLRRHL